VPEQVSRGALVDPGDIDLDEDAYALTELAHHGDMPDTVVSEGRTGEVVLKVEGLTKRFGGIAAAENLNLELRRGTITALVGPNGAGKTTVFNLLTRAIRPDTGVVTLHGKGISGLRPDQVAKAGIVWSFQFVRVFPRLTSLQNVLLAIQGQTGESAAGLFLRPAATAKVEREPRAKALEWLSFVGMQAYADVPSGAGLRPAGARRPGPCAGHRGRRGAAGGAGLRHRRAVGRGDARPDRAAARQGPHDLHRRAQPARRGSAG